MSETNAQPSRRLPNRRLRRASARLLAASLGIVLVWGWFLPWVSKRETVKQRLEFLDDNKIDPSAMFYTELEAMEEILARVERRE